MLITKEEKEKIEQFNKEIKELGDDYQVKLEVISELLHFLDSLVQELKISNPQLALRIMNKTSDIVNRGILNKDE